MSVYYCTSKPLSRCEALTPETRPTSFLYLLELKLRKEGPQTLATGWPKAFPSSRSCRAVHPESRTRQKLLPGRRSEVEKSCRGSSRKANTTSRARTTSSESSSFLDRSLGWRCTKTAWRTSLAALSRFRSQKDYSESLHQTGLGLRSWEAGRAVRRDRRDVCPVGLDTSAQSPF